MSEWGLLYEPPRAVLHLGETYVIKRFSCEKECTREASWYYRIPWAIPELIAHSPLDLVTRRYPVASKEPDWRDAPGLRALLERLARLHIHHRDVHLANVVRGPDGPLLIDWEYAVEHPSVRPYDLYGPDESDVPPPPDQKPQFHRWWKTDDHVGVSKNWEGTL